MEHLPPLLENMGVEWETDCPLSLHSTFHIGGGADLAFFPKSREELCAVLRFLKEREIQTAVIGNGSNVVFADEGYRGAVVFTGRCRNVRIEGETLFADAGAPLSAVSNAARDASLTGLEFAFGIPGTLGGAIVMNGGAYGGSMDLVCALTEAYDARTNEIRVFEGAEQGFGYRASRFQTDANLTVLGATLRLQSGNRRQISQTMREYWDRRRTSQPLELPSAGSVFKRPEGYFAGKLIEDCGLKGLTVGGAQVSSKHAGFIVNLGGATCVDVKRLVERIQETVLRTYGVMLECEIKFI